MEKLFRRPNLLKASLHVLFWCLYLLVPLVFFDIRDDHHLEEYSVRGLFFILIFYLNACLFIPRFFTQKKFVIYALSVFGSIVMVMAINLLLHIAMHESKDADLQHIMYNIVIRSLFSSLIILGISFSFKITGEWSKSEQKMQASENEKLIAELALMKSQINPHFLFNSLNNIYSLAYKKSDDAPTAIVKLSQLMRYMLYDSDEEQVVLSKEVEYIENYIALQKLRLSDNEMINFQVDGDPEQVYLAPMLLIPFIENAFKHGISCTSKPKIAIRLEVARQYIIFTVENAIGNISPATENASGFGLANVQRRLELLYPNSYELKIASEQAIYKVNLKIMFQR
jgi:two-component system, LytTR family, sensor kinase